MNKTHRLLIVGASILAVFYLLSAAQNRTDLQATWPRDAASVRLVDPLPVPVVGNLSGSVQATQSGSWNVNVTNPVSAVQTGPWNVNANLTNQPIAVEPLSVDPRAANAVGGEIELACEAGTINLCDNAVSLERCPGPLLDACLLFENPPGSSALVIEHITIRADSTIGLGSSLTLYVRVHRVSDPNNLVVVTYDFPISRPDATANTTAFTQSLPVRIYSRSFVGVSVNRATAPPVDSRVFVSASGYLVPL